MARNCIRFGSCCPTGLSKILPLGFFADGAIEIEPVVSVGTVVKFNF